MSIHSLILWLLSFQQPQFSRCNRFHMTSKAYIFALWLFIEKVPDPCSEWSLRDGYHCPIHSPDWKTEGHRCKEIVLRAKSWKPSISVLHSKTMLQPLGFNLSHHFMPVMSPPFHSPCPVGELVYDPRLTRCNFKWWHQPWTEMSTSRLQALHQN